MKVVYIVTSTKTNKVYGVFSTKEAAKEYIKDVTSHNPSIFNDKTNDSLEWNIWEVR